MLLCLGHADYHRPVTALPRCHPALLPVIGQESPCRSALRCGKVPDPGKETDDLPSVSGRPHAPGQVPSSRGCVTLQALQSQLLAPCCWQVPLRPGSGAAASRPCKHGAFARPAAAAASCAAPPAPQLRGIHRARQHQSQGKVWQDAERCERQSAITCSQYTRPPAEDQCLRCLRGALRWHGRVPATRAGRRRAGPGQESLPPCVCPAAGSRQREHPFLWPSGAWDVPCCSRAAGASRLHRTVSREHPSPQALPRDDCAGGGRLPAGRGDERVRAGCLHTLARASPFMRLCLHHH